MKVDRLMQIIIYLLNHDQVPASLLANRFDVSVRTVQRDMISISSIGIPVYSTGGKYGGYSILPTYKLKNSNIGSEEQQLIIKALESLATSYTNDTLNSLIEKYNSIVEKEGGQRIFWDFSVSKENLQVQAANSLLEQAITTRRYITFHYRNAKGEENRHKAQPLAIHYKWYAWYLFAYSDTRQAYRTFKIARISGLAVENRSYPNIHGDIKKRMEESQQEYTQTCIPIELHFNSETFSLIQEYFPGCSLETIEGNNCRTFLHVPPGERLWRALLLSLGDKVKVAGPEFYQKQLVETAKKFLSNYDIYFNS